jgi:hypothetical protein
VVDLAVDRDDYFYQLVDDLKTALGDDRFSQLTFDIFEEPSSGATIGIPTHIDRLWEPESGTLIAVAGFDDIDMLMEIGVYRGQSNADAKAYGNDVFLAVSNEYADFSEPIPPMTYEDNIWGDGTDYAYGETVQEGGGKFAEIFVEMLVKGSDFLGSSLSISGPDDAYTDDHELVADMLEFGAFYLSDFATK